MEREKGKGENMSQKEDEAGEDYLLLQKSMENIPVHSIPSDLTILRHTKQPSFLPVLTHTLLVKDILINSLSPSFHYSI